jgi:hypothetical protein
MIGFLIGQILVLLSHIFQPYFVGISGWSATGSSLKLVGLLQSWSHKGYLVAWTSLGLEAFLLDYLAFLQFLLGGKQQVGLMELHRNEV